MTQSTSGFVVYHNTINNLYEGVFDAMETQSLVLDNLQPNQLVISDENRLLISLEADQGFLQHSGNTFTWKEKIHISKIDVDPGQAKKRLRIDDIGNSITADNISPGEIPDLNANKITTGMFQTARIPSLDASKITTGIFNAERIPTLNNHNITALDASVISSGTFSTDRIPKILDAKTLSGYTSIIGDGCEITSGLRFFLPKQIYGDEDSRNIDIGQPEMLVPVISGGTYMPIYQRTTKIHQSHLAHMWQTLVIKFKLPVLDIPAYCFNYRLRVCVMKEDGGIYKFRETANLVRIIPSHRVVNNNQYYSSAGQNGLYMPVVSMSYDFKYIYMHTVYNDNGEALMQSTMQTTMTVSGFLEFDNVTSGMSIESVYLQFGSD